MIGLGTKDEWLEFEYEGRKFEIEVVDAIDMLVANDRRHREDANMCSQCGAVYGFVSDAIPDKASQCEACDGTLTLNTALLRDLADVLKTRFKLPRVSINAAREFRVGVMTFRDAAKKKPEPPSASPTGSESTVEIGAN